ncbi:MAG: tyrosine--tRNA ligase [Planctomycetia bacterium]|nr:tyrosine--tRNA ligase [Planctomycetia bacterium]
MSQAPEVLADLRRRGMVHQTTDDAGLSAWLAEKPRTLYAGFDPTADSLHVGHLVALMILRRFQRAGHRPIAIVGGATGMIGDPSGKSDERNLLSKEQLAANVDAMREQMRRFLSFDGPQGALLLNNLDWIGPFTFLDFLRDVGKNFSVNMMLAKDSVKARLGSDAGLSYTEFSYMLLQAYDFVKLHEAHGCELQVGGSDQWGNITAGIDLGRRMRGVQLYGMTCPLLTDSEGRKMGKSEKSGTVWLSPAKTSPYQFYQYWVNVTDADVAKCLALFTDLSHAELDALDAARAADASKRESQKRLADELTKLVHGEAGLAEAQQATQTLFATPVDQLSGELLEQALAGMPSKELPRAKLDGAGLNIIEAIVAAGLATSNSDARRAIQGGGAYVNDHRIDDLKTQLTAEQLIGGASMIVAVGKKKKAVLRFV